jgi:hypothetical protein
VLNGYIGFRMSYANENSLVMQHSFKIQM